MPGSFRIPGLLGLTGLNAAPRGRKAGPLGVVGEFDTILILSGGTEKAPGIIKMTIHQPMIVGLEHGVSTDGVLFDIKCNDFNNPQGVATVEPTDPDPSGMRRFKVTGKRLDAVMLEARKPMPTGNWWSWPLAAYLQLNVIFDSADQAKARFEDYKKRPIPPLAVPTRVASKIPSDVWAFLLDFTRKHESPLDFLYNDQGNPQRVTGGIGRMFKDVDDFKKNKESFVNPKGEVPSDEELETDYNAAANKHNDGQNLFEFAEVTVLRISWEKMVELLGKAMAEMDSIMLGADFASNYIHFPFHAKVACASIAYGGMAYGEMAPMKAAIKAEDWALAADVYWDPGWSPQKAEAHKTLFRQAVQTKPTPH